MNRTSVQSFWVTCVLLCTCCLAAFCGEIRTLRVQYINAETGECYSMPERPILLSNAELLGAEGDQDGHVLEISFDEMSQDFKQYTYTVRHCDASGKADNLASVEYLDGYSTQDITDYTPSLNTQQSYTHYRFLFPNEDMRLKLSGRYEICIYEDGNPQNVVANVPIYVSEARVRVEGTVLSTTDIELSGRYQQLELELTTDGRSTNLREDYFIIVQQNGRTDNMVVAPQPTFADNRTLRWQHSRPLIFEGGDEYHHFDAYSTYTPERVSTASYMRWATTTCCSTRTNCAQANPTPTSTTSTASTAYMPSGCRMWIRKPNICGCTGSFVPTSRSLTERSMSAVSCSAIG